MSSDLNLFAAIDNHTDGEDKLKSFVMNTGIIVGWLNRHTGALNWGLATDYK